MKARNIKNKKYYTYSVKDNELQLSPIEDSFMQIPLKWAEVLKKEMNKKKLRIIYQDKECIKTEKTSVCLSEYRQLYV